MKSWMKLSLVLAGLLAFGAGCTPQQVQVVAQQAGVVAVATWISVDNPSDADKVLAKDIVALIRSNAASVTQSNSYYTVLMPVANDYISKKVPPKDQLVCQLAAGWLLTGIDTAFAMNPTWKENADIAVQVVSSFCDGATMGLAMAKDDPVMKAAMENSKARVSLRQAK